MSDKFKLIASVYLIFMQDEKVLLLRRKNTGYEDGNYGLVSGHLDAHESLTAAAIREAREESGVVINPKDIEVVTAMHRRQSDERVDFFFRVYAWSGEITNTEPDKCDDLSWFKLDALPENTIPYIRQALEAHKNNIKYTEFGW